MQRQTRRARVGRVTLCFPQCNCSFRIGSEGPHVVSKSSNFTDGSVLTDSKTDGPVAMFVQADQIGP